MKVEMRATVTVVMDFPAEKAAEDWAAFAEVEDILRVGGYESEGVQCFFLEEEDEEETSPSEEWRDKCPAS